MQWTIDPSHSSIEFSVKHLGIATVRGRFRQFSGSVELDEANRPRAISAAIDAGSVDTGVAQRDAHLRSPDFFDAERHPTLTFESTAIRSDDEGRLLVTGDLTIRGETRPVSFTVAPSAPIRDPWGNRRAAASVTGTLSRKDWGLTWNQVLEFGGLAVADAVRFTLEVEVVSPQAIAA